MSRVKLGELCNVVTKGTTPTSVGLSFSESGVPFLRIQNLSNRTVKLSDVLYISEESNQTLNRSRIQPKDFLITIAGTIGKVAIVPDDFPECNCNQAIAILRFNYEKLTPQYLLHWLATSDAIGQISGRKVTATISNLSLGQIKQLEIPLPPLAEQQQIAAILDAADSLRQKNQQLIDHYTALSQSLFLEMFGDSVTNPMGWDETKLGGVCKLQGGFSFKSDDFIEKGVRLIKIANVSHLDIDWTEVDMLPQNYIENYSSFTLKTGDILMALTRPIIKSLGTVKAVIIKDSDLPSLLNQRVARFSPKEEILNKQYLLAIIFSNYFKNKIDKYSSTSLQPNVSNKQIESTKILLPPIKLQNQFADHIALIEQQKQQAQTSLEQSNNLFNSLLQKAFTGELTA